VEPGEHGSASRLDALSPREFEVLGMIALGLTNTEIARRIGVTVHAVKFHLASIYRKLHVANRTEAAVVYLRDRGAPTADSTHMEVTG
jgi:DNA-binding NarL/FixJ family response regulator